MASLEVGCIICGARAVARDEADAQSMGWWAVSLPDGSRTDWFCYSCLERGQGGFAGEDGALAEVEQAMAEAYDLETCARFLRLADELAEAGRISSTLWVMAMRSTIRLETAISHPRVRDWGAYFDQVLAVPEAYEAL